MKYLRIPWGMRAMKELGLTPALCHPDHTMLFPAERFRNAKSPRRAFGQLSGGKSYAPVFYTGT